MKERETDSNWEVGLEESRHHTDLTETGLSFSLKEAWFYLLFFQNNICRFANTFPPEA